MSNRLEREAIKQKANWHRFRAHTSRESARSNCGTEALPALRFVYKIMTQEQIGVAMGYDQKSARKSVSQFLKRNDPRISMLRKFANAIGVLLSQIVGE